MCSCRIIEVYHTCVLFGQGAARGGRGRPHRLAVSAFEQSCTNGSHNKPLKVLRSTHYALASTEPYCNGCNSMDRYGPDKSRTDLGQRYSTHADLCHALIS